MAKHIITLLILLTPLLAMGQSDLYRHYASVPGLTVAQVSGFKLSENENIDVVMLQPNDDKSWQRLTTSFGVSDSSGATSWLGELEHPERHTQWSGRPVLRVVVSFDKRTIGLYRLDNEAQYDALIDYQTNNMAHRKRR